MNSEGSIRTNTRATRATTRFTRATTRVTRDETDTRGTAGSMNYLKYPGVVFAFILICLIGACTTNVTVHGTIPTPLVKKIPANVGVHYSDEFQTFKYKEVMRGAGTWKIDIGGQNLVFFRNLLSSMFNSIEEVEEPPFPLGSMQHLDGVIVPRIVKYGFLTPTISGLKFYSASIQYQILLYDRSGEVIGDWNIVGYGKSEGGAFNADNALGEATMLAIRDGGARIAIEMADQPQVVAWLESLESMAEE